MTSNFTYTSLEGLELSLEHIHKTYQYIAIITTTRNWNTKPLIALVFHTSPTVFLITCNVKNINIQRAVNVKPTKQQNNEISWLSLWWLLHVTFLTYVPETVPHVSSEITIILY